MEQSHTQTQVSSESSPSRVLQYSDSDKIAIRQLINAVHVAQSKGAYTLIEAKTLSECVSHLEVTVFNNKD